MTARQITLDEFLTPEEIDRAFALWQKTRTDDGSVPFSVLVERDIITPNMARINASLGQENDARYLAYAVEYVFMQSAGRKR